MKTFLTYIAVITVFLAGHGVEAVFVGHLRQNRSSVHALQRTTQHFLDMGAECGVTTQAVATSARGPNCPASCPLYVANKKDKMFCSFLCVQDTIQACSAWNPAAPVPDKSQGICRECEVSGCHICATDGTDTCLECKAGQTLSYGKCYQPWINYIWYVIFAVVGGFVVFMGLWIWSLRKRANQVDNQKGLEQGLYARSASKLHKPLDRSVPDDEPQERELWPMTTNLLTTPVAGNGVLHLFRFQFMIIVWGLGVVLAWAIMAYAVDTDFFRLGTRSPGQTPRDNCVIIAWGFTTQQRLMFAKYMFTGCLYVVSFVGCGLYAIRSVRLHQELDNSRTSHKDYAAYCIGLPSVDGKVHLEDELKEKLEVELDQKLVGVSICWDYDGKEDMFMKVINYDIEERQGRGSLAQSDRLRKREEAVEEMNRMDQFFVQWEEAAFCPVTDGIIKLEHGVEKQQPIAPEGYRLVPIEGLTEVDPVEELEKLYSTEDAFIVFETEAARDAAIKFVNEKGGVEFRGCTLRLEEATCEPQMVNWGRITNRSTAMWVFRVFIGFCCILLGLATWCFCFYLPYARSVAKTDYAHGRDPNPLTKTMFGLIVVGGNVAMYFVCATVSDGIGFKKLATREVCYMLLYCFACVFNVLLDIVMAYTQAYKQMVGLGVRTADGTKLGDLESFAGRFDTYAMQKSLGQILFDYAFPSTFLIPFLAEPFVVIVVPYQLMTWIVRSNKAIKGGAAEVYLASCPMDLSRYADVLLNLMLAVLMFFFPGGFVWPIFCGLVISHIWIYAYDHSRVLGSIPSCDFATMSVDWWAQWMLSIPLATLLACTIFKANCNKDAIHCLQDEPVVWWCAAAFFGHIILHSIVLVTIVPRFAEESQPSEQEYTKCAESIPASWFSSNPIHCLRSKYIYDHDTTHGCSCDYYLLGKDHLLRKCEKLRLHFTAKAMKMEEFDTGKLMHEGLNKIKRAKSDTQEKAMNYAKSLKKQDDEGSAKSSN